MIEKREFEKKSILFFSLTMVANIANYIFQIVMGRMLDVELFGVLNALLSLFTIVSIPVSAILLVTSKYVSELNTVGVSDKPVIKKILYYALILFICFSVLGTSLSGVLGSFLKIENRHLVSFVIISASVGFLVPVATGGLQGRKLFLALGVVNLIIPLTKLFGSVIFVLLDLDLYGVILSISLGNIFALITGLFVLKFGLKDIFLKVKNSTKLNILKFAGISLLINVGLTIITNIDIILIKHLFSAEETGIYSTASILGKIILYISTSLVVVMFPFVTEAVVRKDSIIWILKKAILYGGGLSLFCAVCLNIFSRHIISILFGSRYLNATEHIFPISLWIFAVSILYIIAYYLLAIDKAKTMAFLLLSGCLVSIILAIYLHFEINQVVYMFATVTITVSVINSIPIIYKLKSGKY